MTGFRRLLPALLFVICLALPVTTPAAEVDCTTRIAQLEEQNRQLHHQLRSVKRQLAQAQSSEQEPGWAQILGGIGIIFGLFGLTMMVRSRKS